MSDVNALPHAILFGNGLNLMCEENPTWDEILQSVCKPGNAVLQGVIPVNLKYENMYLSQKADLTVPKRVEGRSAEYQMKWRIADASLRLKGSAYHDRLARLNVTHYLTTNCDACFNFTLEKYGIDRVCSSTDEFLYSTSRWARYREPEKVLWNIHGFARHPNSIIVGVNQLVNSIAKLRDLILTEHPIAQRLEKGEREPLCWADFFFTHHLHIVGLDLNYGEMDLWWVLSERKRLQQKHPGLVQNEIHYYYTTQARPDRALVSLLESLGVTVHITPVNKYQRKAIRWVRAYDRIFQHLEERLGVVELEEVKDKLILP